MIRNLWLLAVLGALTFRAGLAVRGRKSSSLAQTKTKRAFTIPACEGISPIVLSPGCWSARYMSIAEQDTYPDMKAMSITVGKTANKESVSKLYLDQMNSGGLQVNQNLSMTVPLAAGDFKSGLDEGLTAGNLAVTNANATVQKMVSKLDGAFNTTMQSLADILSTALTASRNQDMLNLNQAIRRSNALNLDSENNDSLESLNALIAGGPDTLSSHLGPISDLLDVISDFKDYNIPANISSLIGNFSVKLTNSTTAFIANTKKVQTALRALTNTSYRLVFTNVDPMIRSNWKLVNSTIVTSAASGNDTVSQYLSNAIPEVLSLQSRFGDLNKTLGVNADSNMTYISRWTNWTSGNTTAINNQLQDLLYNLTDLIKTSYNGPADSWSIEATSRLGNLTDSLSGAKGFIMAAVSRSNSSALAMALGSAYQKLNSANAALQEEFANKSATAIAELNQLRTKAATQDARFQQVFNEIDRIQTLLDLDASSNITASDPVDILMMSLDSIQGGLGNMGAVVTKMGGDAQASVYNATSSTQIAIDDFRAWSREKIEGMWQMASDLRENVTNAVGNATEQIAGLIDELMRIEKANKKGETAVNSLILSTGDAVGKLDASTGKVQQGALDRITSRRKDTLDVIRAFSESLEQGIQSVVASVALPESQARTASHQITTFQQGTDKSTSAGVRDLRSAGQEITTVENGLKNRALETIKDVDHVLGGNSSSIANLNMELATELNRLRTDSIQYEATGLSMNELASTVGTSISSSDLSQLKSAPIRTVLKSYQEAQSKRARDIVNAGSTLGLVSESLKQSVNNFNSSMASSASSIVQLLATAVNMATILTNGTNVEAKELADVSAAKRAMVDAFLSTITSLNWTRVISDSLTSNMTSWSNHQKNLTRDIDTIRTDLLPAGSINGGAAIASMSTKISNYTTMAAALNRGFADLVFKRANASALVLFNLNKTVNALSMQTALGDAMTQTLRALQTTFGGVAATVDSYASNSTDFARSIVKQSSDAAGKAAASAMNSFNNFTAGTKDLLSTALSSFQDGDVATKSISDILAANLNERANDAAAVMNQLGAGAMNIQTTLQNSIQSVAVDNTGLQSTVATKQELVDQVTNQLAAFSAYSRNNMDNIAAYQREINDSIAVRLQSLNDNLDKNRKQVSDNIAGLRGFVSQIGLKQGDVNDKIGRITMKVDDMRDIIKKGTPNSSQVSLDSISALTSEAYSGKRELKQVNDIVPSIDAILRRVGFQPTRPQA